MRAAVEGAGWRWTRAACGDGADLNGRCRLERGRLRCGAAALVKSRAARRQGGGDGRHRLRAARISRGAEIVGPGMADRDTRHSAGGRPGRDQKRVMSPPRRSPPARIFLSSAVRSPPPTIRLRRLMRSCRNREARRRGAHDEGLLGGACGRREPGGLWRLHQGYRRAFRRGSARRSWSAAARMSGGRQGAGAEGRDRMPDLEAALECFDDPKYRAEKRSRRRRRERRTYHHRGPRRPAAEPREHETADRGER